jgi:5,6-dimethylbenzimidazole synthase
MTNKPPEGDFTAQEIAAVYRVMRPDMDLASAACAIQNLWLAARAEVVGLGWVSLFDPEALRLLLRMPQGSRPAAVLCLGRVPAFYAGPMLEEANWAHRFSLKDMLHTDYWEGH